MSDNGLQRFSDVFLGRIPDYVTADKNFVYPKKKGTVETRRKLNSLQKIATIKCSIYNLKVFENPSARAELNIESSA